MTRAPPGASFVRQIHFGDVLRNFPWLRIRQIRQYDYSQLIVHIAIDRGLESLP